MSQTTNSFGTAFDSTLNKLSNCVVGENGSLAQKSTANSDEDFYGFLCEYFLLMRGSTNFETIIASLKSIIDNETNVDVRNKYLTDLLKITLFLREPRKGKGEKKLFYDIIVHLYSLDGPYRSIALKSIELISDFGYFKDLNHIYEQTTNENIRVYIINQYCQTLLKDIKETDNTKLSLAGKWAPREGSVFNSMAKVMAKALIKDLNPANEDMQGQLKEYRKTIASLNRRLNTVQTFMCQKHWQDIDFKNVPSVAMTSLTKAFQDETVSKKSKTDRQLITRRTRRHVKPMSDNRRHHEGDPDYEDREKCRQHLFEHIKNGGKINSSVTDLSTIIQRYLSGTQLDVVWEAQWSARVEELKSTVSQLPTKPKIFPMVDLSASMNGSPLIYAITFGLYTSQIMDDANFANRFMSFSTEPQLVKLPENSTLKDKVDVMRFWTGSGKWGG